jgi:hypothetical protein
MAPDLVRAFIRSGPGADANYKDVEIVRRNGAQVVRLKVNMDEYFGKGRIVGNPALQAGDTIHFPRDKGTFSPLRIIGVLGSVVGVVTSIVVLTN